MIQKTNKVKIWNTWKGMCRGEIFVLVSLFSLFFLHVGVFYYKPNAWGFLNIIIIGAIIYTRYLTMYINQRKNKYDTKDKGR